MLRSNNNIDLISCQLANCCLDSIGIWNSVKASGCNDFSDAMHIAAINKCNSEMGLIAGWKTF